MDEKGVEWKDDEWRWGTAQIVIRRYLIKEPLLYGDSFSCIPTLTYMPTPYAQQGHILPQQDTNIVESGETHLYISLSAPHVPPDTSAATISSDTANWQVENSSSKATLSIPQLASEFQTMGYIITSSTNTLVGVGPMFDADCTVVFTNQDVTIISPKGKPILTGWR